MRSKHHTVILVPHGRARFRRWRLTSKQLWLAGAGLVLLVFLSLLSTVFLFTKAVDEHQLRALSEENRHLRQANQDFETDLRALRSHLNEIEQRTHELGIVAGVDGLDVTQLSGIGGLDAERRALDLDYHLDRIESSLNERDRLIAATPSIRPVDGILTSGFGLRPDPITGERASHRAVDLSTAPGRPVKAAADGIVLKAARDARLGNNIVIAHGFGYTTRYAHLSRFNVDSGQHVDRGEVIGYVGNTGRTTGYHLHYEVSVDGKRVDPMRFMLDETPRRY